MPSRIRAASYVASLHVRVSTRGQARKGERSQKDRIRYYMYVKKVRKNHLISSTESGSHRVADAACGKNRIGQQASHRMADAAAAAAAAAVA